MTITWRPTHWPPRFPHSIDKYFLMKNVESVGGGGIQKIPELFSLNGKVVTKSEKGFSTNNSGSRNQTGGPNSFIFYGSLYRLRNIITGKRSALFHLSFSLSICPSFFLSRVLWKVQLQTFVDLDRIMHKHQILFIASQKVNKYPTPPKNHSLDFYMLCDYA